MSPSESQRPRVGYVLKMYPRFSETFVVSELLAVEAAGTEVEIFSLRPPVDGRFHESLAEVRAPVTYLRHAGIRACDVWATMSAECAELPALPQCLPNCCRLRWLTRSRPWNSPGWCRPGA